MPPPRHTPSRALPTSLLNMEPASSYITGTVGRPVPEAQGLGQTWTVAPWTEDPADNSRNAPRPAEETHASASLTAFFWSFYKRFNRRSSHLKVCVCAQVLRYNMWRVLNVRGKLAKDRTM